MLVPLENEEASSVLPKGSRFKVCVSRDEEIRADDPENVFLIDHCCTWRSPAELRYYIAGMEGLKERLAEILNISLDDISEQEAADQIVKKSWERAGTYPYSVRLGLHRIL